MLAGLQYVELEYAATNWPYCLEEYGNGVNLLDVKIPIFFAAEISMVAEALPMALAIAPTVWVLPAAYRMIFQNSMRSVMVGGSLGPGLETGDPRMMTESGLPNELRAQIDGSPNSDTPTFHWLNWGVGIQAVFSS